MINDALKLTVDINFPPRKGMGAYKLEEINSYAIEGYPNDLNLWDFLMNFNPPVKPTAITP